MTVASDYWMDLVAQVGCVICLRVHGVYTPPELHHVAEGSGLRSDYAVAGLCHEHHQGGSGLHGMGVKKFVVMYRLPGESEWGLLVWTIEEVAKLLMRAKA